MVGRLLEPGPVSVAWADVSVEDDRRSMASVASTAGTGFISLAHRMAALALDFSDKLEDGEPGGLSESRSARAGLHSLHQRRVDEEDDEDDGTRSERTVNTAVTGDDVEPAGEQEEHMGVGRRRSSLLGGGIDTPDHQHAPHLPFQVCSRLFVAKGNMQLKRLTISQVEELRQHGYVVVDSFIPRELAQQVKVAALLHYMRGRMVEGPRAPLEAIKSGNARLGLGLAGSGASSSTSGTGAAAAAAAASAAAAGGPGVATMSGAGVGAGPGASCSEMVLPLAMGKPPADSTPLALVLVTLQELYEDLHQFTRLNRVLGEYQLALQPPASSGVARHRDALPDGGRKRGHRRLTCMVCCGSEHRREDGGAIMIWPPRRIVPSGSTALVSERSGGLAGGPALRRSLTGSDAGTSFTESDTCSLRSHYTGAAWGYVAPSITSSVWAEAASALDPRLNDDNASLDNLSMSESIDGYAAAVASHMGLGLGAAHGGGHTAHAGGHAAYGAGAAAGNHAAALALGAVLQAATLPGSAAALAAAEARAAATGSAGAGAMSAGPGSTTGQDGYGVRGSALQPRGLEWVEQDGEMVLEVAPLPGRLVLFLSGAVDHALQPIGPAADAAVSVTAWYQ